MRVFGKGTSRDVSPQDLPPGSYQIWSGPTVVKWTGVVIATDSVRGSLEYCSGPKCERSLPRAAVDSIRRWEEGTGGPDDITLGLLGIPFFIGLFWLLVNYVMRSGLGAGR